jgi:hypothetical protein
MSKHTKRVPLIDRLSDQYTENEKKEIVDIVQLRKRWYNDSKVTRSNFELTYKVEHG